MTKAENFYRKGVEGNSVWPCMAGRGTSFDQMAPCIGPYSSGLQIILALKAPSLRSQGRLRELRAAVNLEEPQNAAFAWDL